MRTPRVSNAKAPFAITLTAAEAIREAETHPTTIYAALQTGKIAARKDEVGEWVISRPSFTQWLIRYSYTRRAPHVVHPAQTSA